MIKQILDLHIHSKYSRACSKNLELPVIAQTCAVRGIDIVATGDFTHPKWFEHMKEYLAEENEGIYKLKDTKNKKPDFAKATSGEQETKKVQNSSTKFIVGTEVASIKKHKDKTRRVHHLLFAPNLEVAEKFNKTLDSRGINLKADGRPIIGMTSKDILQLMLEVDERMVMIPAHAWTPWFGIFGSKGGYRNLEEAYDDLTPHIFAIETGLSSDPLMNWRCSWLDNITLISNSDAHSPQKLGREANVLQFNSEKEITYSKIMRILREQDKEKFLHTIEFYPEEGKYHYDGHAACNVVFHPEKTKKHKGICPSCKKVLVIGVMNRVDEIANRTEVEAKKLSRIPYKSLVPLPEILADTLSVGVSSKQVQRMYEQMIHAIGHEFYILSDAPLDMIEQASTKQIRNAVERVRTGNIYIKPGYDGVFGVVKVFGSNNEKEMVEQEELVLE